MLKIIYKLTTIIFTSFIIFVFMINFNFISFKVNIFLRIYYSIKINLIYFIFYFIYLYFYIRYFYFKKRYFNKTKRI